MCFVGKQALINYIDKPVFGQYACAGPSGAVLRVGDEVEVTERLTSRSVTPMSPTQETLVDHAGRQQLNPGLN